MVEDKDRDIEDTPFNMAMLFYLNLNKMIERKDEAYLLNDMDNWFKGLNRIFTKIVFKLDVDEEKLLTVYFSSAKFHIQNNNFVLASEILHRIDVKLINLMNRYKMIFPKIDTRKGLQKIKDKYKLGEVLDNG